MKFKLFVIVILLIICSSVIGQKVVIEETSFDYIRLPLTPFDTTVTHYESTIDMTYLDDVALGKLEYQREVEDAEKYHARDMELWLSDVDRIDAEYDKAIEAYAKKKGITKWAEKTFLEQDAPKKRPYPHKPRMVLPQEPYLSKIYEAEAIASTYGEIEGFKKGSDNAANVLITMHGFELGDVEMKTVEKTTVKNEQKIVTKYYHFVIPYKHAISLRVENPEGAVLFDELVNTTNGYKTVSTSSHINPYSLEAWWDDNLQVYVGKLDDQITHTNLAMVKEELNSHFGYSNKQRNTVVCWMKGKKFNYDDLFDAYETTVVAYKILEDDKDKTEAKAELAKSIEIWNSVLEEYNPDQKKTRLNSKIISAVHYNCAEAYLWLDDFNNSQKNLNRIQRLGVKKYEKKVDALEAFLNEQKDRYNANN